MAKPVVKKPVVRKFAATDRVAIRQEDKVPFERGVVVGHINSTRIAVMLDNGHLTDVLTSTLVSEDLGATEEASLRIKKDRLQREYDSVRQQIADKMQEAANALEAANDLACNAGESLSLEEFYDECRPFMRALDTAGWSRSSLAC
jgi:hypothetical protein